MFKKLVLSIFFIILTVSSVYALDVCNKTYMSKINGQYYILDFKSLPFSPGFNGNVYIYMYDTLVDIVEFHQNVGDPIVNMGDYGVFYQSPSDVLTFIPPPFIVFNRF
jgi:hypothetical protein